MRYLARYAPRPAPCCDACAAAELAADDTDAPPAGPWTAVLIPPPDRPVAVRTQAAEVFRRAVWAVAGAAGWDLDARAAYAGILRLPAMVDITDDPASATGPIQGWIRRAVALVPAAWASTGDPRESAVGALAAYGAAVAAQVGYSPVTYYRTGLAWREQAIADKAAGLYQSAAAAAARAEDAIERMAPGLGFGAALGLGALLVGVAVVVAPEATTQAAIRAGQGIRSGVAKARKR